jgi:NAD(P)-dependent dehydrogenase (short-subunit alcohol dehydrogenase family)
MNLTGQTALITGAAGRLGPIWAKALKDAGAQVALVDKSNIWNECGGTIAATSFACYAGYDIANEDDVKRLYRSVTEECGQVTILVNNAGIDSRPNAGDQAAMFADMVRVNILGTDLMTRVFGQAMADSDRFGSIINIASLYGLVSPDLRYYDHRADGWVKDPIYGATKAAVISLTKYYAAKWAADGVRVNALAPGGVVAPGDQLTAQDPQFVEKYTSRIPMGRMCRPHDLAGPLQFLASDASTFITGQTFALDGGYLCW